MADNKYELELVEKGYKHICGVDETAVGCSAGDVYAAAVIFPKDIDIELLPGLDDSKKKTPRQRETLYDLIKSHALSYNVSTASVKEIAELNIYWAKFLAMRRAVEGMSVVPDYVLVDGDKQIPDFTIDQSALVKGDGKSISIAAASILAKVDRDRYIVKLAKLVHPDYNWVSNKSYFCKQTMEAIKKHGATKWHRLKFIEKYL